MKTFSRALLSLAALFALQCAVQAAQEAGAEPCFKMCQIRLTGTTILSRRKIKNLTREFLGL